MASQPDDPNADDDVPAVDRRPDPKSARTEPPADEETPAPAEDTRRHVLARKDLELIGATFRGVLKQANADSPAPTASGSVWPLILAGVTLPAVLVVLAIAAILVYSVSKHFADLRSDTKELAGKTQETFDKVSALPTRSGGVNIDFAAIEKGVKGTPVKLDQASAESLTNAVNGAKGELKTELETLKSAVAALKPGGAPTTPPKPGDAPDLAKLAADAAAKAVAAERAKELADAIRERDEARKQLADQPKPAAGPAEDLVVVALHTNRLNVATFKRAFQWALADLPRSAAGPFRVGLAVGLSATLEQRVKVDQAGPIKDDSFNVPAAAGEDELPDRFGKTLFDEAYRPDRTARAAVLVASAACPPLEADAPGWKLIPRVSVLLVESADKPLGPAEREKWGRFCDAKNGSLAVVRPGGNRDEADRLLYDRLMRLCQPVAFPPKR